MNLGRVGLRGATLTQGPQDDRPGDCPARSAGERHGCERAARDDRLCRRAADGTGSRRYGRCRPRRTQRRPAGPAQRLSRPRLGDPRRHRGAGHPQAAARQLLPFFPRAQAHGREGADSCDPRGLRPWCFDPRRRRPGAGHGGVRRQQEPGVAALRRDRRACERLPGRSRARGHIFGSMRPASKSVRPGASSRSPPRSRSRSTPTAGARCSAWPPARARPRRSGPTSCAPSPGVALRGVKLVISDSHERLEAAVSRVLHASWQRCRGHFMRNVLAHAGKGHRRLVSAWIGAAFAEADAEAARKQWRSVADRLRPGCPSLPPSGTAPRPTCWRS